MNDKPPISRAGRLDPARETLRQARDLAALAEGPYAEIFRQGGVSEEEMESWRQLVARGEHLLGELDPTAEALIPLGWVMSELEPIDAYHRAAELVRAGDTEHAEEVIVKAWNDGDAVVLHSAVHRVQNLYRVSGVYHDPDEPDIGMARALLIQEAFDSHREGRYAAAINIVLAQIEGVVIDFEDSGSPFFSRRGGEPRAGLIDDETLAGHPAALHQVAKMMGEPCKTTSVAGRLLRHGILHGRELSYGTERNSTQALATLLAVITWAQPKARRRLDAELAEHKEQWAGSDATDRHARRLDRRGFPQAKKMLLELANLQDRFCEQRGRYANSVSEIEEWLDKIFPGAEARASDAEGYWVWVETETGYVFGYAGRSDTDFRWQYAGSEPPVGGVGSGADWRHPIDDPAHPDW